MSQEETSKVLIKVEGFLSSSNLPEILNGLLSNEEICKKTGLEQPSVSRSTRRLRESGEIFCVVITNEMRRGVTKTFSKEKLSRDEKESIKHFCNQGLELIKMIVDEYKFRNKLYLHSSKPIKLLLPSLSAT